MENKKSVWIFSFEYAGVVKVGGLGEVPANQAKHLSNQFNITVFMPSHGKVEELKGKYTLEKLPYTCIGTINPTLLGIKEKEANYNISFHKFQKENVEIILLSGGNSFTSKFLEKTPFKVLQVGVQARNLAIFNSDVPHIDPESGLGGSGSQLDGIERGGIPTTKSFGFNITANF